LEYDIGELQSKLDIMCKKDGYDWVAFCNKVSDWNYIVCNGEHDLSDEKLALQNKLIYEEFQEVLEAIHYGDVRQVKKELVDLIVVSSYALAMNSKTFNNIQLDFDYDCSPSLWYIEDCINYEDYYHIVINSIMYLEELGDYSDIADGIMKANYSKIPLVDDFIFDSVFSFYVLDAYESNPKDCSLSEAVSAQIFDIEQGGRYDGIYYQIVVDSQGKERIVFKDKNGKVMKPCCFDEFN